MEQKCSGAALHRCFIFAFTSIALLFVFCSFNGSTFTFTFLPIELSLSNKYLCKFLCSVVVCGPPPLIGNATRQGDVRRQFGAQVAYMCPVGYGIGGSDRRVTVLSCTADGSWSGDAQPCLRKQILKLNTFMSLQSD